MFYTLAVCIGKVKKKNLSCEFFGLQSLLESLSFMAKSERGTVQSVVPMWNKKYCEIFNLEEDIEYILNSDITKLYRSEIISWFGHCIICLRAEIREN